MDKKIPNKTKVVVIGGGVVGCSVAYHLAKFGWKDTILLERQYGGVNEEGFSFLALLNTN